MAVYFERFLIQLYFKDIKQEREISFSVLHCKEIEIKIAIPVV